MARQAEAVQKISLPGTWKLPKEWAEWALKEKTDWTIDHVKKCAKLFHEYHVARKSERDDLTAWEFSWKRWVRAQMTNALNVSSKGQWWTSCSGIEAKGKELGVAYKEGEIFPYFKIRVFSAAGPGPWHNQR